MAYDVAKLGVRIAQLRKERNLTQDALSQKLASPLKQSLNGRRYRLSRYRITAGDRRCIRVTINDFFAMT